MSSTQDRKPGGIPRETGDRDSRFARWVVKNRWLLLVVALITAVTAGSGARHLAFDNDYRIFFSDENPQLQAFEELQRKYTKIDNILFAVGARDGAVFTGEIMDGIEKLTAEAWKLPYVLRVDAVTNYQHTTATEDDLVVADLVENARQLSTEELAAAREVSLTEPSLAGFLIAESGEFTGVNVTFQMPELSLDEVPTAVAAARELAARIEAEYPVKVHLTGMVMLNNAFFEASMRDMKTLLPLMYLIILLVTYLLVRSIAATIGTLLVLLLSVATAMGMAGWLGIKLTPPSSAAPTIIMTLAVADSVHILITLITAMRAGASKIDAIVESIRQNLQPVILTSITTAVGFLSLNFSDAPPFAHLGNITAMGVAAALFYSVAFLPAFLSVVPVRPKRSLSEFGGTLERLAGVVTKKSRPILWGSAAVALAFLAFLPANEMNDDFVKYFEEGTVFRTDIDETTGNLTGVYQLQYSLDSGNNNGVSDPAFLAKVESFTDWLRTQPEVRQVNSISDTFKRLNKNLHGDDPEYYRIPESRELAAQYLLLYELSLPYGLDLNNQLNVDKSETQVVATLENLTSRELREVAWRGEDWLRDNVNLASTGIGPGIMFAFISDRNIRGMLLGTFLAVVVISGLMMLALRSVRLGTLSLVPNLLPAGLAFGLWGILQGEVNMAVSMVSGMTLGIVVDDSVHFLTKYLRARRENNLTPTEAVHYAFTHVGRAIVVTTIVLVAGFSVLAQSSFALNSYMATLTAIAIAFALVADFLLLPALLLAFDRRRPSTRPNLQLKEKIMMSKGTTSMSVIIATLTSIVAPSVASNTTPEQKGLEIAEEVDRRDTGFGDQMVDLVMILRNSHGDETQRNLRTRTLEQEGDGDKSLIIFDNPGDVKGTAFLSFTHKEGPDDQWLYLPALKRVKRIASSNKSGPFVGSEFSYEDLSSQEVEKYTYTYLGDEAFDDRDHFMVERDPVDPKSGYSRQVVWVDKVHYIPWKVDYYDRGGKLLKTLVLSGYNQYLDQYWRADRWEMTNHQTGKSTELLWSDYAFGNGYSDRDFNKNALAKAR